MSSSRQQWQDEHWHHVQHWRPQLQPQVQISRRHFRGDSGYLLHDRLSGQQHRLNRRAYLLVGSFDGQHTVAQLWQTLQQRNPDDAPDQQECLQLLSQLQQLGLIHGGDLADYAELEEKQRQQQQTQRKKTIGLLSQRLTLLNPDPLLQTLQPLIRPFCHPLSLLALLSLLLYAALQLPAHWDNLQYELQQQALSPRFWLLTALLYPFMKILHELAHGLLLKRFGGEVREAGLSLLVFMPLPFVDATDTHTLPLKRQRMLVSAAGILAELLIAALALLLWLRLSNPLALDICFALMVLGAVSSVLFNANPLLKFDGYFLLSDALDIPNLASRSRHWWASVGKQLLLGRQPAERSAGNAETVWLAGYGLASWLYKFVLMAVLASFFGAVSVWLAAAIMAVMLFGVLLLPLWQIGRYLALHAELQFYRGRAIARIVSAVLVVILLLALFPLPYNTVVPGLTLLPEAATLRAGHSGRLLQFAVNDGDAVTADQVIATLQNPELDAAIAAARARLTNAELEMNAVGSRSMAKKQQSQQNLRQQQAAMKNLQQQQAALAIRSHQAGIVHIRQAGDALQSWIRQGDVVAYVLPRQSIQVRALLRQQDAEQIRHHRGRVSVLLADGSEREAIHQPALPTPTTELPSAALSEHFGGAFRTLAGDNDYRSLEQPIFTTDVALTDDAARFGDRAWVKFHHPPAPLLAQWQNHWQQWYRQHVAGRV